MPKEYFVDIDMTICTTPNFSNGMPDYENAVPLCESIRQINSLFDEGHIIIYWTSRGAKTHTDWQALTEWQLREWGCRYHELRLDKPYYDVLFDDKAQQL